MATPGELKSLSKLSDGGGSLPTPTFSLEPLPPEILRAFPKMKEWEQRTNARLADWVSKTNTIQARTS